MMSRTVVMTSLLHNVATLVKPPSTNRSSYFATNREMETQGKRLRSARMAAGIKSASEAARELGMKISTYNSHERAGEPGSRGYDADDAKRYARRFGVSAAWLLTGEGTGLGGVPLISWVSAGEMATPDTIEAASDVERIPSPNLPRGDWIALRVVGDSMDRISPPDSIIFVNRADRRLVANGCYVIATDDGEATYKRFRPSPDRFEPVSVNPAHEPFFPDGTPTIIGRVRKSILDM